MGVYFRKFAGENYRSYCSFVGSDLIMPTRIYTILHWIYFQPGDSSMKMTAPWCCRRAETLTQPERPAKSPAATGRWPRSAKGRFR